MQVNYYHECFIQAVEESVIDNDSVIDLIQMDSSTFDVENYMNLLSTSEQSVQHIQSALRIETQRSSQHIDLTRVSDTSAHRTRAQRSSSFIRDIKNQVSI